MTPGLAIYKLRLEAGKTTAEAAAEVLVDQRSWQRWESGTHRPILGLIKLFCVLNGINFDKYQELIDEPSPEVLLPQAPDFTEKELLRIIHETGKEKKTDYLPIFYVREKIPRSIPDVVIDKMLRSLMETRAIDLSSLQEGQDYTAQQIGQGIPQKSGGPLFFIMIP